MQKMLSDVEHEQRCFEIGVVAVAVRTMNRGSYTGCPSTPFPGLPVN
jgi:hypothetical protein